MSDAHHHPPFWHALREHATHWVVGGVLIAATGFAPEEWLARTVERLHIPENALHLWNSGIDVRVLPIGVGVAFIVGDVIRRQSRKHLPGASAASTVGVHSEALPLTDRPSIAVLPFANLSDDPAQEYFSDGVADDIITELSHDRSLFVISRNSSFTYRGRSIDIKQVGRELGVRYVVEGSVRREAGRVRVTAQLIDATTDSHVWAERYDRALEHVFELQDEIAGAVARAIRPAVGDAEQQRVMRKPPGSLSAWEEYQRGLWHMLDCTAAGTAEARECFRRSVEIDPSFAPAFAAMAFAHIRDAVFHGILRWDEAGALIEADARRAVSLDASNSEAHAALAHGLMYGAQDAASIPAATDTAMRETQQALALNRNSAWAHTILAGILVYYAGRREEGRREALIALRLNPRDPAGPMAASLVPASYYLERDYEATLAAANRCLADYPSYAPPRRLIAAALGQLGRRAEAEAALREFKRVAPRVFDAMIRDRPLYIRPEDQEHILEGVRKAGWQG